MNASYLVAGTRWHRLALLVGAAAVTLSVVSTAQAQGSYRDRGERYSRAQAEDSGRARTRSNDNTRLERPRVEPARRESFQPARGNDSFRRDDSFRRSSFDDRFDNRFSRDRFDSRFTHSRDRFDSRFDSRSRITLGLNAYSYSSPYSYYHNDYVPRYRSAYYYSPYLYRPAYFEPHRIYYAPSLTRVSYTTYYNYRPYSYYCPPDYGYGYYPRYAPPRTGISFGIRYDYRR